MKKILLVGNYNAGNYGDNLLMIASRLGLKKIFPDSEIRVMSPGKEADYPLPPAGIRSWLKLNFIGANKGFDWCDLVVFGGGGLFNTEVPRSMYIWGKVINKAYKKSKKIYLLGQSFSDHVTAKLKRLMSKVDLITVRDTNSYKTISRLGSGIPVRLTGDLIFTLSNEQLTKSSSVFDEKFIVLNLREYGQLEPELVLNFTDEVVDYVSGETPFSIYLLPFGPGDKKLLYQISSRYKDSGRVILLPSEQDLCVNAIKHSQGVISMRLHPCLIGVMYSKPVLSLSYSSKTLGAMQDLNIKYIDLRSKSMNTNAIKDFIKQLDKDKNYSLETYNEKSADNFRFLDVMVNSK